MQKMIEFDTTKEVQKTLAIIKPDAVEKGYTDEIIDIIITAGFTVIRQEKMQLTEEKAIEFYEDLQNRKVFFYEDYIKFMTRSPVVVLVLAKHDAVESFRLLVRGPKDPSKAKEKFPSTVRAKFGTSIMENAIHSSENLDVAQKEIRFFFPNISVDTIMSSANVESYIKKELHQILVAGLTKLCKEKPKEPVRWLANWLLDNNPRKPAIAEPDHAMQ